MSLYLNEFAGEPILTYIHTSSPGYLCKAIDLKQPAHSHYKGNEYIRLEFFVNGMQRF